MRSKPKVWLHWIAAGGALLLGVGIILNPSWQTSVLLVVWLSVYAVFASHLAAAEAARPDPEVMRELRLLRSELSEMHQMVMEVRNRI